MHAQLKTINENKKGFGEYHRYTRGKIAQLWLKDTRLSDPLLLLTLLKLRYD